MSTLTFSNTDFATPSRKASTPATKLSFGKRLVNAMIVSRQRQAEIEIRKVRALIGDKANAKIDYAMLPFSGE
jgi:hypothetical protein